MATQTLTPGSAASARRHSPIYLAGEWVEAGAPLEVRNPYNDEVVGVTYQADEAALERAIVAAQRAFHELAWTPAHKRAAALHTVVGRMRERREDLARSITLEAGKPIKDARVEVDRAMLTLTLSAEEAQRVGGEVIPLDLLPNGENRMGVVRRFPIGPVAAISPFNFPLNLAAHKVGPALASGNPVVLKPPSKTPLTWLLMAELFDGGGLPKGALSVLPMDRRTGARMVSDDRFKLLSFTGSDTVGWKMKADAGKKKVVLELGGNAGVLLDRDTDVELAAKRLAVGAFAYAGQICISVQRIYVHRELYEGFKAAYVREVEALPLGDPLNESTAVPPMVDRRNLERTESWVREALAAGARVLTGGERQGPFYRPTVLEGVPEDAKLCQDEAFAPVVDLYPVESFEQGLDAINRSRFGLQAGVFTKDLSNAMRAFHTLEVGGLVVNDIPTFRVDNMPYGGVKDSGLGREGIRYAIEDMTEPRIMVLTYEPPKGPESLD
jgi:glyceraldehyde-3-phosphate dehydrogenase (NADP+)